MLIPKRPDPNRHDSKTISRSKFYNPDAEQTSIQPVYDPDRLERVLSKKYSELSRKDKTYRNLFRAKLFRYNWSDLRPIEKALLVDYTLEEVSPEDADSLRHTVDIESALIATKDADLCRFRAVKFVGRGRTEERMKQIIRYFAERWGKNLALEFFNAYGYSNEMVNDILNQVDFVKLASEPVRRNTYMDALAYAERLSPVHQLYWMAVLDEIDKNPSFTPF